MSVPSDYTSYQWYLNGTPIPDAVYSSYTAAENGTYTILVTDSVGCILSNDITLSIREVAGKAIRVYPNPTAAGGMLHIQSPVPVNISLLSMDGKELLRRSKASGLDVSALAAGVYMLRITGADGRLLQVERLLKK